MLGAQGLAPLCHFGCLHFLISHATFCHFERTEKPAVPPANSQFPDAFAPRNDNRESFTGQEHWGKSIKDDLRRAVCRVLGGAGGAALRRVELSFHLGQAFQHTGTGGAVGEDSLDLRDHFLGSEVVLD
jgi:hypothetical protein